MRRGVTADVDGDADFDSSDLVLAFRSGGYEIGPRPVTSPKIALADNFDSPPVADGRTEQSLVSLVGETDPFVSVELLNDGRTIHLGNDGRFSFVGVELALGDNPLTFRVSDIVGNESSETVTIHRFSTEQSLIIKETADFGVESFLPIDFEQIGGRSTLSF